jgi:hypothetical protein
MEKEMKTLYIEGVALRGGPESCVGDPVRAQRSVDRGRAGGVIEPRNNVNQGADVFEMCGRQYRYGVLASRGWTLRGRRSQARTTSSMRKIREISWSPVGGGDALSWMVRGVAGRYWSGREGNA